MSPWAWLPIMVVIGAILVALPTGCASRPRGTYEQEWMRAWVDQHVPPLRAAAVARAARRSKTLAELRNRTLIAAPWQDIDVLDLPEPRLLQLLAAAADELTPEWARED